VVFLKKKGLKNLYMSFIFLIFILIGNLIPYTSNSKKNIQQFNNNTQQFKKLK
jgi:hypothetical protein